MKERRGVGKNIHLQDDFLDMEALEAIGPNRADTAADRFRVRYFVISILFLL